MEEKIYVRLKKKTAVDHNHLLILEDISYLTGNVTNLNQFSKIPIYQITDSDKNVSVIDGFVLIDKLIKGFPHISFELIGPNQVIVEIKKENKKHNIILITFIWILLCVGSAMAIMNFHYDVSMQEVQKSLAYILTSEEVDKPLWIQIPYSIGLGLGMILFFNHIFKKRFNEEPSPLEVEMFNYQQDLDNYLIFHENIIKRNDD